MSAAEMGELVLGFVAVLLTVSLLILVRQWFNEVKVSLFGTARRRRVTPSRA